MCGIVGYVGHRPAADYLLEGLRRLEYRGYDSAGIATLSAERQFDAVKAVGRIEALAERAADRDLPATTGIGHTRWTTHGVPSEANAHPHFGGAADCPVLALAHNGVIENYLALKEKLLDEGYAFSSYTDTEVIAHLIARSLTKFEARREEFPAEQPHALLRAAVEHALAKLRGTYGLVILFRNYPGLIVAARQGSPLVVGIGQGEHFVASDASPLAGRTEKIVYLAEQQMAFVTADSL